MANQWLELWTQLNSRQKHFLKIIYHEECIRADYYARRQDTGPVYFIFRASDAWTWMVHREGRSGLFSRLGHQDLGAGSTYKSLSDRGFLERRFEPATPALAPMLYIRLTRRGRRLIREQLRQGLKLPPLPHYSPARSVLENGLARNMRTVCELAGNEQHELSGWKLVDTPGPLRYSAECRFCGEAFEVGPQPAETRPVTTCPGLCLEAS